MTSWQERFWAKVDKSDPGGCWLWTGQVDKDGYGRFTLEGKKEFAHRVAYKLLVGPLFPEQVSRHQCPHKNCIRPDHIIMGTTQENVMDTIRDGHWPKYNPKRLTDEEVLAIRKMYWYDLKSAPEVCKATGLGNVLVGRLVRMKSYKDVHPMCEKKAECYVLGPDGYVRPLCKEHAPLYAEERGGTVYLYNAYVDSGCYYVR
jgi:hypothetical protein